ncbi:hypothetical protein [Mycoavidus cysteinexigens]|nr:hypothetical protein [Mycoavidus cysteinexigens]GAM52692.1 hypothetical protein EBME_1155 [bacterium endosymbiont of Mortierella elongata FMR23-6]
MKRPDNALLRAAIRANRIEVLIKASVGTFLLALCLGAAILLEIK